MAPLVYACEIVAYDPGLPGTRTLYYASRGFCSTPADTPANTHFDERLQQPAGLRRDLFDALTTSGRSRTGYGDLVLENGDGALDALIGYGFDGRALTIRQGTPGAAYPSGYSTVLVGTMEQVEVGRETVTVKLRDRQAELNVPLQATKYAGDNVLPDGLEGVATDLKGKPKPLCFGKVLNVPAVPVNTSKLIYQVHDGAIATLDGVYDRGVRLDYTIDEWTALTTVGFGSNPIRAMAYGEDKDGAFNAILVGDGGDAEYSTGGNSLTLTHPFTTENLYAVAFGDVDLNPPLRQKGFIIAGSGGVMALFSNTGTYDSVTSGFGATSIRGVAYARFLDRWIAVGDGGALRTSDDLGQTWDARTSGVATDLLGVVVGSDIVIAFGASGVILSSPDGTTWTTRVSGFGSSAVRAGVYSRGQFLVVGEDNKVGISTNGIGWVQGLGALTGATGTFHYRAVADDGGAYVAVGDDEGVTSSRDGRTWVLHNRVGGSADEYLCVAKVTDGQWLRGMTGGAFSKTTGAGTYASAADLEDDALAPAPGTYKVYLAGGYFRLGAPPAGLITADVTQGAAASDRTAGQLFTDVLTLAGHTSADWSTGDITALDTANDAVLGFWTQEEMTCAQVLNLIAQSVGAWWGVDRAGLYRIKQLTAPSGTAVLSFVASDILKARPLTRLTPNDVTRGLPVFQTIVRWGRVYAVQTTDLAGAVTPAHRALVGQEWREATDTDTAVQTIHLLAPQTVEDSLLTTEADAVAEAERRQTLRGVLRHLFQFGVELNAETVVLDLGDVVDLTHDRYGLSGTESFRVLGLEPDATAGRLGLVVWG